ncbi:MAG: DCC1-like thiol-disulfide oxidoreductase family protein [Cytophagaceae bacterium]
MKTMYLSDKPVVLWDMECDFCRFWIKRWERWSEGRVEYKPYQSGKSDFPDVSEKHFKEAVCMVESDGHVLKGAEAALKSMVYGNKLKLVFRLYKASTIFKFIADKCYLFVSKRRDSFYRITTFFLGKD